MIFGKHSSSEATRSTCWPCFAVVAFVCIASKASAAQCGNTAAGFEAWKNQFAGEARARGANR